MNQDYVKHIPFLEKVMKAKRERRYKLLERCDPEVIRLISDAIYNILKGNIRLTERHYKKLSPHKRTLIFLGKKSNPLDRKHALLKKKGGNPIAAVLPYVIPTIISLISSFASSK